MYTPKSVTHGDLPHWHMGNAFVFITFRLADSLPVESLRPCKALERQWNEIFNANPTNDTLRNQYYKERAELVNNLLDQSLGSCILKDESIRQIVVNAIHYFDNKRYHVCDYVIMPNHVHMLIETFETFVCKMFYIALSAFLHKKLTSTLTIQAKFGNANHSTASYATHNIIGMYGNIL